MSVGVDDAVGTRELGGEIFLNTGGSESLHRMPNTAVLLGL